MAIHWFFFVVPQSWARTCVSSPRAPSWPSRVEKWAHPVFPLQTRHPTLPLPGRPQRSLAKLWNAIKDVEWVALRRQKPDLHELVLLPRRCTCRPDARIISLQCLIYVFLIGQQFISLRKVFFQQIKIFCQIFSCTQKNWHNSVFSQTGWFWWTRELSWLRPAPTSCLCQQPLSLHSFSQGTKPSHTELTSWTAPENLKSISLNRILLGDVSVTRRK